MLQFENEKEVYDKYKEDGKELVIFKNKVYDVSKFINMHPGGKKILEE